jgi:hypothetical protein
MDVERHFRDYSPTITAAAGAGHEPDGRAVRISRASASTEQRRGHVALGARPTGVTEDWLTQAASARLATRIYTHWRALGHFNVRVWSELASSRSDRDIYVVRSNLIRGLPPPEKAE